MVFGRDVPVARLYGTLTYYVYEEEIFVEILDTVLAGGRHLVDRLVFLLAVEK